MTGGVDADSEMVFNLYMSTNATFTAHVSEAEGFIITKDVPAGICGPFIMNSELVTREQAEAAITAAGFVMVGDWELVWTFHGPAASVLLAKAGA